VFSRELSWADSKASANIAKCIPAYNMMRQPNGEGSGMHELASRHECCVESIEAARVQAKCARRRLVGYNCEPVAIVHARN